MEWTPKLEARTGWGEVTDLRDRRPAPSFGDLTADGVGLAQAQALPAELQQRIAQGTIDGYVTCVRVCPDCM